MCGQRVLLGEALSETQQDLASLLFDLDSITRKHSPLLKKLLSIPNYSTFPSYVASLFKFFSTLYFSAIMLCILRVKVAAVR